MRWGRRHCALPGLAIGALLLAAWIQSTWARPAAAGEAGLRSDETLVVFPNAARSLVPKSGAAHWEVSVHVWVFEPEADSLWRNWLLRGARRSLGLEAEADDSALFRRRALPFLADSERGRRLEVEVAGIRAELPPTGPDGHARMRLAVPEPAPVSSEPLTVSVRGGDGRVFETAAWRVPAHGVTVVSDLDDTVKVSQVRDRAELLRNTFLREFRPVAGMAERYREWEEAGAHFSYLSASPWQLYEPLAHFLGHHGFPKGPLHLKHFRLGDDSFLALFEAPERTKTPVLEHLLRDFPERRFVLVGDSGERDPEIYGALARRFPERIDAIYIRELASAPMDAARREGAWHGLDPGIAHVFREPAALPAVLPAR